MTIKDDIKYLKVPAKCPVCSADTYIESVRCPSCQTAVTNKFAINRFDKLSEVQVDFILTFIGVEGNIKEMEKALGISYPTVKSRLGEIQQLLGLKRKNQSAKQMEVLQQIERGELSVDAAIKIIKETTNKNV